MTNKITLAASILGITALVFGAILFQIPSAQALTREGSLTGGCVNQYLQTRTVTNFPDDEWNQQIWPSSYNTVWCPSMD